MPNRRQAIIWTNADLIHWCIYVALGGDELMCKITGRSTHMVSELLFMASRTSWYFSHTFAYLKVINYFEIVTNCSHYYSFLCWCILQLQYIVMLHFVVDPSPFFRELQSLNAWSFMQTWSCLSHFENQVACFSVLIYKCPTKHSYQITPSPLLLPIELYACIENKINQEL